MSMPTVPYTSFFAAATYAFPGPVILSTGRDRRRPECECSDGLRTADPVDLRHAALRRGNEHGRRELAVLPRGGDHDDLFHTGDGGGNGVHDDRRRIRRLAAGDIDADTRRGA